jgi:hypothetical protein
VRNTYAWISIGIHLRPEAQPRISGKHLAYIVRIKEKLNMQREPVKYKIVTEQNEPNLEIRYDLVYHLRWEGGVMMCVESHSVGNKPSFKYYYDRDATEKYIRDIMRACLENFGYGMDKLTEIVYYHFVFTN